MYYRSLIDGFNGTFKRNNGKSVAIVVNPSEEENCVRFKDGQIVISDSTDGQEIFGIFGDAEEAVTPVKGKYVSHFKNKDVAETKDNPLIVVATNKIRFYKDIPTSLEVLFINDDYFLAMLVYGACDFLMNDTQWVALQRCCDKNLDYAKYSTNEYTPSLLKKNILCVTKGGFDTSYEMVVPVLFREDASSTSFRAFKDKAVVFNQTVIDEQLKKEEEEREAIQRMWEEKHRKAEEERKEAALEAKRRQEEEAAKIAEAKKRGRKSSSETNVKIKKETRNISGAEFLKIVNNL